MNVSTDAPLLYLYFSGLIELFVVLNREGSIQRRFGIVIDIKCHKNSPSVCSVRRCRARLVNVDPVEIYFIDYGNSEKCQKEDLHELAEDLRTDPPALVSNFTITLYSPNEISFTSCNCVLIHFFRFIGSKNGVGKRKPSNARI